MAVNAAVDVSEDRIDRAECARESASPDLLVKVDGFSRWRAHGGSGGVFPEVAFIIGDAAHLCRPTAVSAATPASMMRTTWRGSWRR